ncbi:MAG: hypothetical protein H6839_00450 [Planctomycetes bacterium]|nr:hypothetical protein [Planctomycetota bacterium]
MDYEATVRQTSLQMTILAFSFISGVAFFTVAGFVLGPLFDAEGIESTGEILRVIALVLPIAAIPAAMQVFMSQSKRMAAMESWEARIGALRGRTIVMTAMFEGPALFSAVVILLTGFTWHAAPALLLFMAAMGGLMPTRGRIINAVGRQDGSKPDAYS